MRNIIFFFLVSFFLSCSPKKRIIGNYYCSCYNDFFPRNVIKINKDKFELYSANISGEKYIGNTKLKGDVLYLYRTSDLVNNYKDTLPNIDTSKFVIKGKKLIPFKDENCFYKKTTNKNKLFQLPYLVLDTIR